jgi:hypothetical protein
MILYISKKNNLMINDIINGIKIHNEKSTPEISNYGEVFTEIKHVLEIISIIDDNFWKNPNLKILDPCNGVGNFPSIIIQKLMIGLVEYYIDETDRYKYIIENMIYVCEIQPRNMSHYIKLFNKDNLYNLNTYEGSFLEDGFKNQMVIWNIQNFDLVVGNPPYQIGNDSRSSVSIYHRFVQTSVEISNNVLMITPSKWYSNPSMKDFRYKMINTYGLKVLNDIKIDIFNNVDIKGGVSYFHLEKGYEGECLYNNVYKSFKNDLICEDSDIENIVDIIKDYEKFDTYLKSDQYFDIRNNDNRFMKKETLNSYKCYVSIVNGSVVFIDSESVKYKENISKYKVFIPTASGSKKNIGVLGRIIIGEPNSLCSRSFVHFAFDTLLECESFVSYINTDIIKSLISINKQTQLVNKNCFSLVPIIPLDRIWANDNVKDFLKI